jgi:PAS domain S-box-containing protein
VRRRWLAAAFAVGLLLTAASIALAAASDRDDGPSALFIAVAITAGFAFVVSGLIALWRRPENRTGLLMAVVGFAWFFNALTASDQEWVFAAGFVLAGIAFGAFVHLMLAFPAGHLSGRFDRWLVGLTYLLAMVPAALTLLVDETPVPDCGDCPESPVAFLASENAASVVRALSAVGAFVLLGVVLVHVIRRYRRATPPLRRMLAPVLLSSGVALVSIVAVIAVETFVGVDEAQPVAWFVVAAFAAVPFAFLLGVLRARLARSAVGDLLLDLGRGAPLRDALARALNDPGLDIAYWIPDQERYVSSEGKAVREGGHRATKFVEREGRPIAALLHDPLLGDQPELVDSVAAAAGLWLENEQLQAELRAHLAFLETIVNTAPSLLVNIDVEGRIVNFNEAVEEATGIDDPEQIRGRYFWEIFFDPEEREDVRQRFTASAPEFAASEYENESIFTNAQGERVVIAWRSVPFRDEEGVVRGVIGGGLDITERKRQELELRESEERLRAAIESSPVAIVEVGLDSRIRSWNPAAEKIFGWTAEEALAGPLPMVPEEQLEEYDRLVAQVRRGESYTGVETVRRRKDGTLIDVGVASAPMRNASGTVTGHMVLFADITERKRKALALESSEERLRATIDASPVAIVELGVDGDVLGWNAAAERTFGWTSEEVVGGPLPIVPPGLEPEYEELVERVRRGEIFTGHETVRLRKDGALIDVEISSAPLHDSAGAVVSYTSIYVDSTERKQREVALRASEERLRATIDASPVAIVEMTFDDVVLAWNAAAERIFGWSAAEVVGQKLPIVPPELEEVGRSLNERVRAGEVVSGYETRRRRKDSTELDVEVSGAPIRDSTGTATAAMAVYVDVTERKQRELELQRERDFLDTIADATPSFIVVVDTEGRITHDAVNREFTQTFGWSPDEAEGHSFLELVAPEDDYSVRMAIAAAANGVPRTDLTAIWLRQDGSPRVVAWTATPLLQVKDEPLVLITGADVTERVEQEEELRASRQRIVATADAERRRLERNLHDGAQQRLVALSVSLRLAEARLEKDPEGARELLTASREELSRAIDELRELARGIHPAVLSDRGLEAALEALTNRVPLPVDVVVPNERLPAPVEAAAYYLVAEALTNIAKYADATSARVEVTHLDGTLTVEVSDDGVGGADPANGTGLRGLSDRVAALDGTLTIESPAGGGTKVHAEIPVREPALVK